MSQVKMSCFVYFLATAVFVIVVSSEETEQKRDMYTSNLYAISGIKRDAGDNVRHVPHYDSDVNVLRKPERNY